MPHMMPTMWMFIFIISLIILFFIMSMIYFFYLPTLSTNLFINLKKSNWIWKW